MEQFNAGDFFHLKPAMRYFGGEAFTHFMMHLMRLRKVNKLYTELSKEHGLDFIDKLIESLELKYSFDEAQLAKIPATGSFIVVSNHPYGGLDGILLIKIITQVRPDFKILANPFLQKIEPLQPFLLISHSFHNEPNETDEHEYASTHLDAGFALGIFPAGEASGYDHYYNVSDKEWQPSLIRLIQKAEVPVVPVYFSGSNSRIFHLLGMINPKLKMAKLPSELFHKKRKEVSIRIGSLIRKKEIEAFTDIHQLGRYLRARTYVLGAYKNLEVRKFFKIKPFKRKETIEDIVEQTSKELLLKELESLQENHKLFSVKNYSVYCAPAKIIPHFLNEIGRLREITFREVGEGTNRSIDIDEYDLYYYQMFIWDDDENCIVGAYRMGTGHDILEQFGLHGFYISSLFRIKSAMKPVLDQSLELGRSFVVPEYQRKPLPLFLLWKGILYFLLKNPQYRYLLGPVSISNNYSTISKDSIIRFITDNYFNRAMGKHIKPLKSYRFVSENDDINLLLENAGSDLNKFDKIIGDIDKVNNGIPVLLKKYLSLNAKILAFNVDPNFNNCLDGLIILDIYDVPQNVIESLSKEVNDGSILERFYSSRELNKPK
ncbi:MAG: lysophospholipid acyltransferase family protein [Prolixibacteraceae bacterium]|nr:lysophospholipid acyltransferase family protein [Prolixibacteraceae bacterium]MBN2649378.1 lysophospholipid acyltransferase family protein [Prolixibacteraceae bacterium]